MGEHTEQGNDHQTGPTGEQRVLVVGASRGTGREVVRRLLADGHRVTALGRTAGAALADLPQEGLETVSGDVLDAETVEKAMIGHDAVVVTLGISDNPVKVLIRRGSTPLDVRSRGTATVIAAMRAQGLRRVVVQTTYGTGETFSRLSLSWKLTFRLLLRPQIADTEKQEALVRASGLDWTVMHPVGLTDEPSGRAQVTEDDRIGEFHVARAQVAEAIAGALTDPSRVEKVLSVSTR